MARGNSDKKLASFFARRQVATMEELRTALETNVDMTVYRALKKLGYRTSYSHGGRYYALSKTVQFDDQGLWSRGSVWFSQTGTLVATMERLIAASENGFFADELQGKLHVGVRESLLRLIQKGAVSRERLVQAYLYCSKNASVRRRQVAVRKAEIGEIAPVLSGPEEVSDEIQAAIFLFAALLDERQLRLFAGIEALQFGRGAEQWVADLLGIHRQTVAKGRSQLLNAEVGSGGIRKKGAGRPVLEKKRQRSSRKSRT